MRNLKDRTKQFAIDCWKFCAELPHSREYNAYVNQLIRSSSSVGANYRAAQRAKSDADFINKLKIVEEEADESMYFLELLKAVVENNKEKAQELHSECNEIISIVVASINTTRKKIKK